MYYIVYKTTNIINNKFYIGAHRTKNINDDYLGSGVALINAIKKYGKENFIREILHIANTEDEMFLLESKLIEENKNNNSYNLMPGGKGGFDHINLSGKNKGKNNPMCREDVKQKCIESGKATREKNPEKYRKISLQNLESAIQKNIGSKRPEHSEFMKKFSKNLWEKNKEIMRDALSSYFMLTSPDGLEYTTNRLQDFCTSKNIPYTTVWKSSVSNEIIKKGRAKGWKCKKI